MATPAAPPLRPSRPRARASARATGRARPRWAPTNSDAAPAHRRATQRCRAPQARIGPTPPPGEGPDWCSIGRRAPRSTWRSRSSRPPPARRSAVDSRPRHQQRALEQAPGDQARQPGAATQTASLRPALPRHSPATTGCRGSCAAGRRWRPSPRWRGSCAAQIGSRTALVPNRNWGEPAWCQAAKPSPRPGMTWRARASTAPAATVDDCPTWGGDTAARGAVATPSRWIARRGGYDVHNAAARAVGGKLSTRAAGRLLSRSDAAVDLLMSHLRSAGGQSPLPYTNLRGDLPPPGDRSAYELSRARFNNASTPTRPAGTRGRPQAGAEDYPATVAKRSGRLAVADRRDGGTRGVAVQARRHQRTVRPAGLSQRSQGCTRSPATCGNTAAAGRHAINDVPLALPRRRPGRPRGQRALPPTTRVSTPARATPVSGMLTSFEMTG